MKKLNIQIISAEDKVDPRSLNFSRNRLVAKSGARTVIIGYAGGVFRYVYRYNSGSGLCYVYDSMNNCIYSSRDSRLNTELGSDLQYTIMMMSPIKCELV